MSSETKVCQNCNTEFTIEPDDFDFYKRIQIPPPTWCPECRFKRRLIFWNQRSLFRRKDAETGKEIFSLYPEASPIRAIEHDRWWSDSWDPMDYGREYDFSRPFLDQLRELMYEVPWSARSVQMMEDSDYSDNATGLKNCYLCFNGNYSEDCLYGVAFNRIKSSMDFFQVQDCELCYEVFSVGSGYRNFFTNESGHCQNVWFCLNCVGCSDCFGCVNLRNKKYHIFNRPYTKEEYERKISEMNLGSHAYLEGIKKQVYDFWLQHPVKYMQGIKNKDVIGAYVYNSKNVKYSYQIVNGEDLKYCQNAVDLKDAYDYTSWGNQSEFIYETVVCGMDNQRLKFCYECWPGCHDLEYSLSCHSSSYLFGCVGLKKKQYCVLNKQYSKGEYEELVPKIKKHMDEMPFTDSRGNMYRYGEFLPVEFSPFAYNESAILDFYPVSQDEARKQGFEWRDVPAKEYETTLEMNNLPDHIRDVPDSITEELIACADCQRAYRIVPMELQFLRRFQIPIPRKCHNCRHEARARFQNPHKWYKRQCACDYEIYKNHTKHSHHPEGRCPNEFETSYAPERKEIVYCEECYNAEVV